MTRLGIDIGSLYIAAVLVDGEKGITARHYREHGGEIHKAVRDLLRMEAFSSWDTLGITGSMAKPAASPIDPTLAVIEGAARLLPSSRNLVSLGGQSFSLILLDSEGRYREHTANPPCAAGTGSFLEQQAERLGLSACELSKRAFAHEGRTPRIATRCAVFSRTDIVHAMQEGHSVDAICAGLCEGVARSVLDTLLKGRELSAPVGLVGGVSLNKKIASAMQAILGKQVIAPVDSHLAAALGAALLGAERDVDLKGFARDETNREVRPLLSGKLSDYPDLSSYSIVEKDGVEIFNPTRAPRNTDGVYLGIDIGSTSTKAIAIDGKSRVLAGFYTRTGGEPVQAVQRLLHAMEAHADGSPRLLGVKTTGSGRKMIREIFRADGELNEITAHAKAAVFLHPGVDTIIEIGGQDSKFTRLRDGDVYLSSMNYVCAAGTGSFIEEQAKRLGVSLGEFADMALKDSAPLTSDRCTVYMERDIGAMLGEGWPKEALAASVLHSVRDNYLSKVVGKTPIGEEIVFQGATARNRGLVAAFEQHLGKPIHVSPYCHLTGALGAALSCLQEERSESRFIWETGSIRVRGEECRLCANRCHLMVAERGAGTGAGGASTAVRVGWGMKCGREYSDRRPGEQSGKISKPSGIERRFMEHMGQLYEPQGEATRAAGRGRGKIVIGIPRCLYNLALEPLWHAFLTGLGFSVRTSEQSGSAMDEGVGVVNSDFCAPMILSHGYVRQLIESGVDYVFYPAIANEREGPPGPMGFRRRETDSAYCYYSQYLPSVVGKLTAVKVEDRLISPLLALREKNDGEVASILHAELVRHFPDVTLDETLAAFAAASTAFSEAKKRWSGTFEGESGRSVGEAARPKGGTEPRADGTPLRVAIMGRPYIAFDRNLHLLIPRTFEELGAEVFWQDEFDLDGFSPTYSNRYIERMHWQYGKRIARMTELAARTQNLYPVFLTCFRCSPDSFLMSYVKDILSHFGKPFLILQLDAHASDVGYTTRIEAALDSFRSHRERGAAARAAPAAVQPGTAEASAARAAQTAHARNDALAPGDTVLISAVDDLISRFWADSFHRAGYPSLLLSATRSGLQAGSQYASGGECMPLVYIIGAAIERVRKESLDPLSLYFFIPTIPLSCNIPQFPILADMAFRAAGMEGIKVGLINFMALSDSLPQTLAARIMESYIVGCILYKLRFRIRPYEKNRGDTKRAFKEAEEIVSAAIRGDTTARPGGGTDLRAALSEAAALLRDVPRDESAGRKPRIAILGDLYVKYNDTVNEGINSLIEELDGEVILSSMSEYPAHLLDIGARLYGEDPRSSRVLRTIEGRYEKIVEDLIGDQAEPDFAECVQLMERYGLRHYIAGETSINLGRALWYCCHRLVDAIVHVNPMFCCPGVVSASLYRKVQEDFGIPVIDIFYDGTGNPNRTLIPHLHYLGKKRAASR